MTTSLILRRDEDRPPGLRLGGLDLLKASQKEARRVPPPGALRPPVGRPHCVRAAKRSASSTGSPVKVRNSPPTAVAPAPPRYTGYFAASSRSAPATSLKSSALTALTTMACGR